MLVSDPSTLLAALLVAGLLDALFGEPDPVYRRVPHPVVLIGRLVAALERGLLIETAGPWRQRVAGRLLVLVTVGTAAGVGVALHRLADALPYGWLLEAVLMSTLLALRSLHDHVAAVAAALDRGLEPARQAVARIVGRDPQSLDEPAIARAAIESTAENLSDGVIAPLLWGLLLGLPGMLAYKAVNTLDSMVGHRSPRYLHFGRAAARLDDLVNLVPARATALLVVLAALLLPGRDARAAWRAVWRDARHHRSPNAGWPEAAFAGALGLRIAGPRRYAGVVVDDPWMGDGRAEATVADIRRALVLLWATAALAWTGVAAAWLGVASF
jgi:adenosylcobinamide-phosphate synthase